jgi:hypothetical protein
MYDNSKIKSKIRKSVGYTILDHKEREKNYE